MSNFADPKWWPQRPPPAPKRISLGAVLLGAMVPLVVGAAIALVIVTERQPHASDHTIAAYDACLLTHGDTSPTATGRPQAIADCRSLRPTGPSASTGGLSASQAPPPGSPEARFRACLEHALAASGGAQGGFGHGDFGRGGPSSAFRAAELVCASIAGNASGHGEPVGPSGTGTTSLKL